MARLKFDDIDEWTPSSISIVDEPSHPLCKFEVYEDDEEYVKKSIEVSNQEGENMVEETTTNEPTVEVSQSFLEKLLGRSILKSEEPTPVKKETDEEVEEEIPAWAKSLIARIEKLEEKDKTPTPGAVPKSESAEGEGEAPAEEAEESSEETEVEETEEKEETVIDDEEVVSKSIDPDLITSTSTDKSLAERTGRNSNGMTW